MAHPASRCYRPAHDRGRHPPPASHPRRRRRSRRRPVARMTNPPAASTASHSPDPLRALWIGYACAALGATLFSTKAIIIKLAYAEGTNAETLLALRMALSLPFYGAIGWMAVRDRRKR